jgi:hypothetical protein
MEATMTTWKMWIRKTGFAMAMILAGYVLGSHDWGHRPITLVHAQTATTNMSMPKAWGPMIGTMTGVLVFQDRSGTIRLVAADTGVVGEVITRN